MTLKLNLKRFVLSLMMLVLICATACVLSGCYAAVYGSIDQEDTSNTRELGETSVIDYSFSMVNIYKRGPYQLSITPYGVETITTKAGKEVDAVKVAYTVLSTNDGKSADFGNCCVATNILTSELKEVSFSNWLDQNGAEMDARNGKLEIGQEYILYIPLTQKFEQSGLYYITVSDRSGYYERTGNTYWYLAQRIDV